MRTQFNKDVSDYKSNFWKGLTFRQTVCGAAAILCFVLFRVVLNIWFEGVFLNIAGFGGAILFAFLGFFKKNRMQGEELALLFLRYRRTPKVLLCRNKPIDFNGIIEEESDEGKEPEA